MTSQEGQRERDFLFVADEGFLQRHRSLTVVAVALLALLAVLAAWEFFAVGSGHASGTSAAPGVLGVSGVPTSRSAPPSAAPTPTVTVTVGVPSPVVIERTATTTVTPAPTVRSIVPDVFKLGSEDATRVLTSLGLAVNPVESLPLHGESTDIVTKQDPAAGTSIPAGSTVSIYYFKAG
jgi:hypothetical protein